MAPVCARCGAAGREGSQFCPTCGKPFASEETRTLLTRKVQVNAINRLIDGWVFYAFAAFFGLGSILGISVAFTASGALQLDLLWSFAGFLTTFLILLVSSILEWGAFRTLAREDQRMVAPARNVSVGIAGLLLLAIATGLFLLEAWNLSIWPLWLAVFAIPIAAGAGLLAVGTHGWYQGKRHLGIEYGIHDLVDFFHWDPFLTLNGLYQLRNDFNEGTTEKFRAQASARASDRA